MCELLQVWSNQLWQVQVTSLVSPTSEHENESRSVGSDSLQPHGLHNSWNSLGQNTGTSNLSLLQRLFPNQELNHGLLHCRQIPYQLSYQGSPIPF